MDCRELMDHLDAVLEGERSLDPALLQHLAACLGCRQLVATCRQTILVYRSQPAPPIPAALHRKVMKKVNGTSAQPGGTATHPRS